MTADRVQARVFGEVADEYDRVRPGYPDSLLDDVLAYLAPGGGPALEVGAGTGRATLAFARRGLEITAVEPDPAMAAVLSERLAGYPDVTVVVSSFEEYAPDQRYTLLYSAQAWHWTDPATRWSRAAAALAPGGALALFWNHGTIADPATRNRVRAAHASHDSRVVFEEPLPDDLDLAADWPGTDLATLTGFGERVERLYRWPHVMSSADYLGYLSTVSAYRMMPEPARDALSAAVAAALPDQVELDMYTVLYLARRLAV